LVPQLEVIVAAYNAEKYLEETLRSLLAQGPWLRVRVVDDCSTDATREIVARYLPRGQVTYQRMVSNSGRSSAPRNAGLARVQASFVCFFDADDVMEPEVLGRSLSLLMRHPRCGVISADYRNFSVAADAPHTHFQTCPALQQYLTAKDILGVVPIAGREARLLLAAENFAITGAAIYAPPCSESWVGLTRLCTTPRTSHSSIVRARRGIYSYPPMSCFVAGCLIRLLTDDAEGGVCHGLSARLWRAHHAICINAVPVRAVLPHKFLSPTWTTTVGREISARVALRRPMRWICRLLSSFRSRIHGTGDWTWSMSKGKRLTRGSRHHWRALAPQSWT